MPPEIDAAYATGLESLTLRFANATMTTIGLSSDAAGLFRDFQGANEQRLAPEGPLRPVAEWGNKLPGHVLRLAGILHVAHHNGVGDASITAATMSAAIELAEYFAAHYLAVASLLIQTDADAYAHRILEWIRTRRPESFTQRDLHRSLRATVSRSADLDEPLRLLVERNYLTRAEPDTERRGPGRKPSPTYIPHRSLLQAPASNLPPAT